MISATSVIHDGVMLGPGATVEEFCIIGVPCKNPDAVSARIGANALLRSHTVIYAGNVIGDNFHSGHKANIRECNRIGNDVSVGTLSVIEHHVTIGNRVHIHTQVFIPEYTTIEDDAWLGPNVVCTNAKYPRSTVVKEALQGPHIGRNAKICANATLLPGVVIGEDSLVGAGAVVVDNVPDGVVVVGNPARVIRRIADLPYQGM